jgi:hypothetical protein
MTDKRTFHFSVENFDKLYRGEPLVDGKPGIQRRPMDIDAAQPFVMELEALGGVDRCR